MIRSHELPLLVPALLRTPNWGKGIFSFRFSGEGPVETAPILVQKDGLVVATLTPLPAWVADLGPQPVALQVFAKSAVFYDLQECFQDAIDGVQVATKAAAETVDA